MYRLSMHRRGGDSKPFTRGRESTRAYGAAREPVLPEPKSPQGVWLGGGTSGGYPHAGALAWVTQVGASHVYLHCPAAWAVICCLVHTPRSMYITIYVFRTSQMSNHSEFDSCLKKKRRRTTQHEIKKKERRTGNFERVFSEVWCVLKCYASGIGFKPTCPRRAGLPKQGIGTISAKV